MATAFFRQTSQRRGCRLGCLLLACLPLTACDVASTSGTETSARQSPDPVVVDFPIAYVERSLPVDENGALVAHDLLDPAAFQPGARLVVKARAQASAPETIITEGLFAASPDDSPDGDPRFNRYDVKDLDVSPDGTRLLFAMRAPAIEGADEDEQPTWNIWEYHHETGEVRRIIESDINAEQGQDVGPAYLPDGRIVFASTRQRRTRAILLDENRPQYAGLTEGRELEAFTLHVMDDDGLSIEQITFNQSHDLHPTVLFDGRIAFLRWDGAGGHDHLSLYTVNPDGTDLALLYGYHSQNTGSNGSEAAFAHPRELDDGRLLVNLRARESSRWGGDMVAIDSTTFVDVNQPTADNTGAPGPAQRSQAALPVLTDGRISRHGYFSAATPLYDGTGRMLVSWSQCRVLDPETGNPTFCSAELLATEGIEEADPLYSLWIYDAAQQTQLPVTVATEGKLHTEPVVLAPRTRPNYRLPKARNSELADKGLAVLHIRSVYDFDGSDMAPGGIAATADPVQTPAADRPARFLRIVKPVPIPSDEVRDFDNSAFGVSNNQLMREIVGYVPVEPDGSVKFKVPADIAFAISVVDARGQRIGGRHNNWLTLRPGETRECDGCHTADSELPHGRPDAEAASVNPGAPASGVPFANTRLLDGEERPGNGPEMGETMAAYYARLRGPRTPSMNIAFVDDWTDENAVEEGKAPEFSYRYTDICTQHGIPQDECLSGKAESVAWRPPALNCGATKWHSGCRVAIHYPTHIQPLWEAARVGKDEAGREVDHRCIRCHSEHNITGVIREPAGQLVLTRTSLFSPNNRFLTSYAELLRNDNAQVVNGEVLEDEQVETGEYITDDNGDLVLDENGAPIPILTTVPVRPSMSTSGARASSRFFDRFYDGSIGEQNHAGMLSEDELKLIAEWLDIGAQYYNDPFVAPVD